MVNGEDIVIWRSVSGEARAWENRCIHRGMRLSFGQVRGEQLSCRYHGWLFDLNGQVYPYARDAACRTGRDAMHAWLPLYREKRSHLGELAGGAMSLMPAIAGEWYFGRSLYHRREGRSAEIKAFAHARFPPFAAHVAAGDAIDYHSESTPL